MTKVRVVLITSDNTQFVIELKGPTEQELSEIDGPDVEGQTTSAEVWLDRKLKELADAIKVTGYKANVFHYFEREKDDANTR